MRTRTWVNEEKGGRRGDGRFIIVCEAVGEKKCTHFSMEIAGKSIIHSRDSKKANFTLFRLITVFTQVFLPKIIYLLSRLCLHRSLVCGRELFS